MMVIQKARRNDVDGWLALAAEVEHLFGPMVNEPGFMAALTRNMDRGSAYCIREDDGPAGAPLQAGLLFSAKPPIYKIGWLAVSQRHRRKGLGSALLAHVIGFVKPPGEISVITFGSSVAGSRAARAFYLHADFSPAEMVEDSPEGESRQVFRKRINGVAPSKADACDL